MGAESSEARRFTVRSAVGVALYALELLLITTAYFALARTAQLIPAINPAGTPLWPPSGIALALFLLRGYRVWPAIFAGSFLAGVMAAHSLLEADLVAIATLLGALAGNWLLERWSNGRKTFATPLGVAKFALIAVAPTALASATLTAAGFTFMGATALAQPIATGVTWWLADAAGSLLIAPVIVRQDVPGVFQSLAIRSAALRALLA